MAGGEDPGRTLLRHTVATLAYRAGKALRGAPAGFATFRAAEGVRTPGEILAHLGDLFDWAVSLANGGHVWKNSAPLSWEAGTASGRLDGKLFQGPVADALAHVGQIAILRRLAGAPIRGENYFKADIEAGRVGTEQSAPRLEFD